MHAGSNETEEHTSTPIGRTILVRYGWAIVGLFVAASPLVIHGATRAMQRHSNDIRQWLPDGFHETRDYDWFRGHFGNDEIAIVSWDGCTLDDPRMDLFAQAVVQPAVVGSDGAPAALFQRVVTGRQLMERLTARPAEVSVGEAAQRLRGTFVGGDQQTTCAMVVASPEGEANRAAAVQWIRRVAVQKCGVDAQSLHLGGPTVDAAAIDVESRRSLYELAALAVLATFTVACLQLKSFRLALIVLVVALYSTVVALAIVYWTGGVMNLVLVMLPTVVFVLTVSGAVHLLNYYRDALAEADSWRALEFAIVRGWLPCTLAALTTAIGLGSLGASEIGPVRQFGIYSAVGMLASLAILLILLPCLIGVCRVGLAAGAGRGSARQAWRASNRVWLRVAIIVDAWHRPIVAIGGLVLVMAGIGLLRLEASVKLLDRFSPSSPIVEDCRWLEQNLGPLVPIEIVLRFDGGAEADPIDRLRFVGQVERAVGQVEGVDATMSAATFLPPIPAGSSVRQVVLRSLFNRRLEKQREELTQAGYLVATRDAEFWRITARVRELNDLDYGVFIDELQQQVDSHLRSEAGAEVRTIYTGSIPLLYKAQHELLNDLVESFTLAFASIGALMVIMFRGLRAGLVVMIPNVFPVAAVFGCMAWLRWRIDIGSVLTASLALGIAVDDTVHFLTWFRRGLQRGASGRRAIYFGYRNCARAMIQTTIICGLGLAVFMLSNYQPMTRFAGLMATMLAAALVGDLIFMPAILVSPVGRWFR